MDENKQKILSVIMCNYNHGHFLKTSLGAILSQSDHFSELIFIDDGSTDNSLEVVNELISKNDNIFNKFRLIKNSKNCGALYCANLGLSEAAGEYIYSAAADDKILPNFFYQSKKLLLQYPKAAICFSDPAIFTEDQLPFQIYSLKLSRTPTYFDTESIFKIIKNNQPFIAGHSSIFKKKPLVETGGWLEGLKWHCDWWAIYLLSLRFGACYIPEPLAAIRVTPSSFSNRGVHNLSEQNLVLKHMLDLLQTPEYSDVLPYFQKSGILATFGIKILKVVVSKKEYRSFLNLLFLKKILFRVSREIFSNFLQKIFKFFRKNTITP